MKKSNTSNRTRVAVAVVVLALLAAACGSSSTTAADEAADSGARSDSEVATQSESSVDPEPVTETAESAEEPDDEPEPVAATGTTVDLDLFMEGALAEEVTTEDCTLTDGTTTTCYRITVAGYPADGDIGPFCPTTTDASADEAGIWFDGEGVYDLDGEFIVGLADHYDDDHWLLHDEDGHVHVTDTSEAFDAAARPNVDPEYQNHCVEGRLEWLDGGEPITTTVLIPATPVAADNPSQSRDGLGVTLNGVTIANSAPVDAILGAYTIAAFDDCGGHINPIDGYHLHGAVGCGEVEVEGHAAIFGYALDGYGIYSPYDDDGETYTDLDVCGGHATDELGYHYHASPAAENAVISCLSGETARSTPAGSATSDKATSDEATANGQADAAERTETQPATGSAPEPAVESGYLGSYSLTNEEFGTMVAVTVDDSTRIIDTNALPDHATGEFPNPGNPNAISEQARTWEYPLRATYTAVATEVMVPGVAVNGIKFEPGTAETISCATGERSRVEAIQDVVDLGLDFNNAHVQPTGEYHYHGISALLVEAYESDEDLVHIGFAADGHLIYYSKSGTYQSSYALASDARTGTDCVISLPGGQELDLEGTTPDGTYTSDWIYTEGSGDLDQCNGTTIDGQYAYLITDTYPYISRCLMGEAVNGGQGPGGSSPGGDEAAPGGARPGQRAGADLSEAAEALGVSLEELEAALGDPPPDLNAAAETLGVTVSELEAVLPRPPGR